MTGEQDVSGSTVCESERQLHRARKLKSQDLDQAVHTLNQYPLQLLWLYVLGKRPKGGTEAVDSGYLW